MQLRQSTPYGQYGRYLSKEKVDFDLDHGLTFEQNKELVDAFEKTARDLVTKYRGLQKNLYESTQERTLFSQTEQLLGLKNSSSLDDLDDFLDTKRVTLLQETSLAQRWMNAITLLQEAENSPMVGSDKERAIERARLKLVQTADDFKTKAVRAAKAYITTGRSTSSEILIKPPRGAAYELEAKALKKSFAAMSLALDASMNGSKRSDYMMTIPCAVLVEYCGRTVLATCVGPQEQIKLTLSEGHEVRSMDEPEDEILLRTRTREFFELVQHRFPLPDINHRLFEVTQYSSPTEREDCTSLYCFVKPDCRMLPNNGEQRTELDQYNRSVGDKPMSIVEILSRWRMVSQQSPLECFLEEVLHFYGRRMRDLYAVMEEIVEENRGDQSDVLRFWVQRIKVEMISRAFHKIVNETLRSTMFSSSKKTIADVFNGLLGILGSRDEKLQMDGLWQSIVNKCMTQFGVKDGTSIILDSSNVPACVLLLRRTTELLGVEWRPEIAQLLTGDVEHFNRHITLEPYHIVAVHPRVKQMHLVFHSKGLLVSSTQQTTSSLTSAVAGCSSFDMTLKDDLATSLFVEAFRQQPWSAETLRELAGCYRRRWTAIVQENKKSRKQEAQNMFTMAEFFMTKALQVNFHDEKTLFDYAVLQDQKGFYKLAADLCRRALVKSDVDESTRVSAQTLLGDLSVTQNYNSNPEEARRHYLSAMSAAEKSSLPCPHAKINYAVLLCKPPFMNYYAAGCAFLHAAKDSGYKPPAVLLWDMAQFSDVILTRPDLSKVLRNLIRCFYPDYPLPSDETPVNSSGSLTPRTQPTSPAPTSPFSDMS